MNKYILKFRASDKAEFETIIDGRKTVETRAATPRYQKVEAGDTLVIKCGDETVEKKVKKIEHFGSIDELIKSVGLENVMPLAPNIDQAKSVWRSFPGYDQKIKQYGLIAWYI